MVSANNFRAALHFSCTAILMLPMRANGVAH